jgi:HEAT repeat protein
MSKAMAPEWIKHLDHSDFCLQSWRNSPEAVANWVRDLTHVDPGIRAQAARSLGGLGLAAEAAVEPLKLRLRDADQSVRSAAAHALEQIAAVQAHEAAADPVRMTWAIGAGALFFLALMALVALLLR